MIIVLTGCKSIPIEKQRILARETIVFSTMYKDYQQTMQISKNPDLYYEKNRIMGRHPSSKTVKTYFLTRGLIHVLIAYVLPERISEVWQSYFILESIECVINNEDIGIGSDTEFEFYIKKEFRF